MNLYLLWGFICCLNVPTLARKGGEMKLLGEDARKVEIELDLLEGNALITYNDLWKTKAKISYAEKKKIVAYRDEEVGRCLLEKITKHKQLRNGNGELSSRTYHVSQTILEKVKAEKLAGRKLVGFCSDYPITLLKEYPVDDDQRVEIIQENNERRAKRESDVTRGNESQLSHQEISKKLLEDLANADGVVSSNTFSSKGVKRNVNDGNEHGRGHHSLGSAKMEQQQTVDYHTHIRNNLPSGVHPMHPIGITSSVTIATGASSHPIWSYHPSAGLHYGQNMTGNDHHGQGMLESHGGAHHSLSAPSAHQNTSQLHHHGHHHSHEHDGQTLRQDFVSHPSSSGQFFKPAGYYPPSSTSKTQQNTAHYPPSSTSKTQSGSVHYLPSSFSKPQQNTAYYPPSSTSKNQYALAHFPSSVSKSPEEPAIYPPSSGKSHHPSTSLLPQPGPAFYPPSSFSKTHQNATSGSQGIHFSLASKTPIAPQYSQSSHSTSHRYHPSYVPPSSTSKIHYTAPQPQNTSHSSFNHVASELGGGVYAPQFPPSSTSKVYHHQEQYGTGGRSGIAQYPPSSTSKLHHSIPSGSRGGSDQHTHGIAEFSPSSTSKVDQPGSLYAPQFPPSSTTKLHYSPGGGDSSYGHTPVLERPSGRGNTHERGSFPPSSTSKVLYSPHSHVMPTSGNTHSVQYYPPSSSSKVHHSPSNSGHPYSPYPPSSTSKLHYPHSTSGASPAQIPQPPIDRNAQGSFPPSSTSKQHHPSPSSHTQHYSPEAMGSQPVQSQHRHSPASYPSLSTNKVHQTGAHQNFSSTKQSPEYYPSSSASNVRHSPINHQDHQTGGRVTAVGRVSITPGFGYYPPSSSSKNTFVQQGVHYVSGHQIQQYPYYGPSSSSYHHNGSVAHGISGIHPSPSGHGLYSPSQYPPSSTSKIHPTQQQNGSVADHIYSKPFYPVKQHPPSTGGQVYPLHHNDSSSGQVLNPSQGGHSSPSGHIPSPGAEYFPQYPPSSFSQNHQQAPGSIQSKFYHDLQPSGQGSHAAVRPCQNIPRSLYSITTRTILTPNGAVQRPVSVKTNGEYPCEGVGQALVTVPYARYAPCSGTLTRNGQMNRPQTPCTANGNLRKSMRNGVPGPAVLPERNAPQQARNGYNLRTENEQHQRIYSNSGGAIITNVETQTELLHGMGHHHRSQFSKLQAAENSTSDGVKDDAPDDITSPEYFEENGRNGKDVEVFERNEAEDEKYGSEGQPVKYQENEEGNKTEEVKVESEEEVKEGDVLEPGDRILGKDGYTILDGFRGRVVSVTGLVGKTRAETAKEIRVAVPQETEKKSNSGQFKYSSNLGRYVKENGEKNYSNCQGEPTFTCSEFLGSNGRAKICKPNPRRNPDGSPC